MKLDNIDRKILGILQHDSTVTVQEIAGEVGLTNNPCWRRIKRLEDAKIIERRVAVINPKAIGLTLTAFVSIKIDTHTGDWLAKFVSCIDQIPEIVECHRMTGDVDYLLKVLVRDLEHYDRVYQDLISRLPGFKDVSATFSMEQLKQGNVVDASTASD